MRMVKRKYNEWSELQFRTLQETTKLILLSANGTPSKTNKPAILYFMCITLLVAGRGREDVGVHNPLVNPHAGIEFEPQQLFGFNVKSNTTTVKVGWDRQKAKRNRTRKG